MCLVITGNRAHLFDGKNAPVTVIYYFYWHYSCHRVVCFAVLCSDTSSVPVDAGRANLLAAIRDFNKTQLSRAGERKIKKKKKHEDMVDTAGKAAGSSGGGGDLMSDLAAKLQMRRKGISGGAGKAGSGNGGGASDTDAGRRAQNPMDRVSKMIPPPPPKPTVDRTSSHEDDWLDS